MLRQSLNAARNFRDCAHVISIRGWVPKLDPNWVLRMQILAASITEPQGASPRFGFVIPTELWEAMKVKDGSWKLSHFKLLISNFAVPPPESRLNGSIRPTPATLGEVTHTVSNPVRDSNRGLAPGGSGLGNNSNRGLTPCVSAGHGELRSNPR